MTFQLSFTWRFFASILLRKRIINFSWTNRVFLMGITQLTLPLFKNNKNILMICTIFYSTPGKSAGEIWNFSQPRKNHIVKHFRGTKSINLTPDSGLFLTWNFEKSTVNFYFRIFLSSKRALRSASRQFKLTGTSLHV